MLRLCSGYSGEANIFNHALPFICQQKDQGVQQELENESSSNE